MLVAIAVVITLFACADDVSVIDVGDRKQLLIDSHYFAQSENISLRVAPPTKTGERTLVSDRPWENASLNWFSVLEDSGKYRMWYECYDVEGWPTPDDTSFCYAESTDGIHWNKPPLGLSPYHDAHDTNILFRQVGLEGARSRVHGAGVFLDPNAPQEARYKAVSQGAFAGAQPPQRIAAMTSPDGLRWSRIPHPVCDVFADSQYSAFWDADIAKYVLYGRVGGRGRAIGRTTSATFDRFDPLTLVFQTDESDPANCDLYNPAALKYPYADRVYFMFPSMYRHDSDTLDIHIAVSRDGVNWSWPERGVPFVPLGGSGNFDSGSLYMGQGMLRAGSELYMYYSGSPLKHNEAELPALLEEKNKRVFSRVTTGIDRFVCADAGEAKGHFVTPPVTFRGSRLYLNVKARSGGQVRAALLDSEDRPIPGLTIADCVPITDDAVDAAVKWSSNSDLQLLAGKPVKIRLELQDASLFAFQFR